VEGLKWKELIGWSTVEGHLLRRKHFTPKVLARITEQIQASEADHSGELMVAIEAVSPAREPDSRMRALEVFGRLQVWDTPLNTGVLLYLALDRHCIELIADRGIGAADTVWKGICAQLQGRLRQGDYVEGILAAVEAIEQVCRTHCPPLPPGEQSLNSLPDEAVML